MILSTALHSHGLDFHSRVLLCDSMTGVPLWNWMQKVLNVRSMVDVGCGRGISTKWFLDHGSEVLCVEGSHDAVEQSLLPRSVIVEHDFSRGPWWPNATYDLAWSVEFLEHVGRHYAQNYMPIFRRSALAFVTHSTWGGPVSVPRNT